MGRRAAKLLGAAGVLLILAGAAYYSWIEFLRWREQRSPSTAQVLVLRDGREVAFVQPPAPPQAVIVPATPAAPQAAGQAAGQAAAPAALPPERLRIAKIGVDWPVVLGTNEHMPRFKGVGWLMGSGFPGAPGNMVLFGHLGGAHATFERLHELAPGDEFVVATQAGELRYRVDTSFETTPDDTSVLLPTDGATATLITCSGPWNEALQTNERRRIVVARLAP